MIIFILIIFKAHHEKNSVGFLDQSFSGGETRLPLALQAIYHAPLRREPQYGLPVCDLQVRSYSPRNLEFQCDFALRAAYYLGLPALGPIAMPLKIERWTVPRSNFVHKKSQENFERVTSTRVIQIQDGHPQTVELWLAFIRKHAFYGVGMKANIFALEEIGNEYLSLDHMTLWTNSGISML